MIKVGIENLSSYLELFKNQRVGLVTNPTGVDHRFRTTIEILKEHTQLTTLFSPEHGIRGDLQAGVSLDSYEDLTSGCMVYSLYGKNKRPTLDMLQHVDLLCFDIQDVGARFYTYIVTLAYLMEAAKAFDKTMVVFDRPNPLGGIEVEGNILDLTYRSFVGYHAIVQRYGLTIGELAWMMNDHFQIGCKLHIIPMVGYKRSMHYKDTNRYWILPSPNIPTATTVYSYLATCLFEGTNLSEGRGTTKPFEIIGAPWLDAQKVLKALEKEHLAGVQMRATYFQPMFSKYQHQLCQGIELHITDPLVFKPIQTGIALLYYIKLLHHESFSFLPPYKENGHPMIDLLVGDSFLRNEVLHLEDIYRKLNEDSSRFKRLKERYHLYEI